MIPEMDNRNREDILKRIERLSKAYTPEWRFDLENPDMGTAAASVYADLMMGTIEKYNRTSEKNMVEFFDRLGAGQLFSEPAGGYVSFSIEGNEGQVSGELVEKGTLLNAQSEMGETVVYTTAEPLYVTNTHICSIVCEDSSQDQIFLLYQSSDGVLEDVSTVADKERNLQKHSMYFYTDVLEQIDERARGVLTIFLDSKDEKEREQFLDAVERGRLSYYGEGEQGFIPCMRKERDGENILFEFSKEAKPEKTVLFDREGYWFLIEFAQIAKIDKSYIREIRLGTMCETVSPDGVFNEMAQLTTERFYPFDVSPLPYTSVYISSAGVLGRKGAEIEVEFQVHYERNPINESDNDDDVDWKYIMKKSKFKKPKEYDVTIKSVIWEYFNGSGWVRLFADNSYSEVFDGNNDGQTVKITFICPVDCETYYLPSGDNYCIRARIATVDNYMKTAGYYVTPYVTGLSMKYRYGKLPGVDYLVTDNCMEQKRYELGAGRFSVRGVYRSGQIGKSMYVGFSMPPDMAHFRMLFCLDKSEYMEPYDYVWEYYGNDQWQKLSCKDETAGLMRTGLLSFEKQHRFGKLMLFGEEQYWIRLRYLKPEEYPIRTIRQIALNAVGVQNLEEREMEYFLISPNEGLVCRLGFSNVYRARVWVNEIEDVSGVSAEQMIADKTASAEYDDNGQLVKLWVLWREFSADDVLGDGRHYVLDRENSCVVFGKNGGKIPSDAASENVRISYETCAGEKGNLLPAQELQMGRNTGLISSVRNPLKISGGRNKESISDTLTRCARQLRMNGQLSVNEDYEFAAQMVERNIIKVKCMSNRNVHGEKEYGAVTLVVLLQDTENLARIANRLRLYFDERLGANVDPARFMIAKPDFLDYDINAVIKVKSYHRFAEVQSKIREELIRFFDWTDGGQMGRGWEIGEIPEKMDIYNILAGMQDVEQIDSFYIHIKDRDGQDVMDAELETRREKGMVVAALAGVSISISED